MIQGSASKIASAGTSSQGERLATAERDRSGVAFVGQHDRGGSGVVSGGRRADPPLAHAERVS